MIRVLLSVVFLIAPTCVPSGPGTGSGSGSGSGTACSFNSDCPFGEECSGSGGTCVASECHEGDGMGIAALPCPAGMVCTFADGVDLNHGNGWCEPSGCMPGEHQLHECEFGQGGTFNYTTCECDVPCMPGEHQLHECEFGQGGTFNYMTCECDL